MIFHHLLRGETRIFFSFLCTSYHPIFPISVLAAACGCLCLYFSFFSSFMSVLIGHFSLLQGFVNSGYGVNVNGLAHVSTLTISGAY